MPADIIQRAYRLRIALFLLSAIVILALLSTAYQAIQALTQLDVVERQRDQWQRPSDIVRLLDAKNRSVVADLGCGSGYFTLKLSPTVGAQGQVFAIDIRRLPLAFLRIRTLLRSQLNISLIHAQPDNPGLPAQAVDAVLIANTYHEFVHPNRILTALFHSLRPGGRLVVVDRGPASARAEARSIDLGHHELPRAWAETSKTVSRSPPLRTASSTVPAMSPGGSSSPKDRFGRSSN
jgi:ubiquinone/menaquinone biosynthesis C-methylase UbiE